MKKIMKRIIMVVLILLILCSGTVYAMDEVDKEEYGSRAATIHDILSAVAELNEIDNEVFEVLAKIIRREGNNEPMDQRAAIVWCVLNRVDIGMRGDGIIECATASSQFAWVPNTKVQQRHIWLARNVVLRWLLEKRGCGDVGRTLPKEYLYFASHGDGINWFRIPAYWNGEKPVYWGWTLDNPYEEKGNG